MNLEHLPGLILLTLVCLVAGLALWYLGIRRSSLRAKQLAVMIAIFPVLGIGLQLASAWFGWTNPAEFRTTTTTQETVFPVTNPEVKHQLVLTPQYWGTGDLPPQPVRVRFTVQSPKGEAIATGEQELAPMPKLRWSPLRAEFQPREEGEHKLLLQAPKLVGSVEVLVRELRESR